MAGGPLKARAGNIRFAFVLGVFAAFAGSRASAAPGNFASAAVVVTSEPPTSIAASPDGSVVFVGMDRHFGRSGGIAAYRRMAPNRFESIGTAEAPAGVRGLALSADGATLAFTTRDGPGVVTVRALTTGRQLALAAQRDGKVAGSNQIVVSTDGVYAFYTNQRGASLGVARIATSAAGAPTLSIVAHVALDRLPGGIAASPDGTRLYVTSEIDNVDPAGVAGADDPRLGRTACDGSLGPHGVLSVIDARQAVADPAHAVLARVAAACAPVRVALSPDGDVAWVSTRGEDRALAFATSKLIDDPSHALLARLDVGPEPIGVLATRDGKHVAVVASDGEADRHAPRHSGVTVFDAAAATRGGATALETLGAGTKPREIREAGDGTVWVTDYAGKAVRALAPF